MRLVECVNFDLFYINKVCIFDFIWKLIAGKNLCKLYEVATKYTYMSILIC